MPPTSLLGAAVQLSVSLDALAALAAHTRVVHEGLEVDPRVRALLDAIAAEVAGPDVDATGAQAVIGMVRAFLRQAVDLVERPDRLGDWAEVDPALLQGIGRLSGAIAGAIGAATTNLPALSRRLTAPGARLLDVGTGTAWLAIAMARAWPACQVVGLDVHPPALALARSNVAQEGLEDRVVLRLQDIATLDEPEAYDVIWLPLPFLPRELVPAAMAAAARALRPGGFVLPGLFAGTEQPISQLLADLRTVRSGGHPWSGDEIVALLSAQGLVGAGEVPRTWPAPVKLYAAWRPEA